MEAKLFNGISIGWHNIFSDHCDDIGYNERSARFKICYGKSLEISKTCFTLIVRTFVGVFLLMGDRTQRLYVRSHTISRRITEGKAAVPYLYD